MKTEYKLGLKNLIPLYGLKKFIDENPEPSRKDREEANRYDVRGLTLLGYNIACGVGLTIGIFEGLEKLLN